MKKVYSEAAESTLGRKKSKKPKPFISKEVIDLAKQKSDARKCNRKDEYHQLKREIKSKIREEIRKTGLPQECAKINEHNENRK